MRDSPRSVILVGPPNSGKTTLFNWITNSRFRAVNYPGSTVDCLKGMSHGRYGPSLAVVDSPGIYSLEAQSPDEEVTLKLLFHESRLGVLDTAIVCVDATQLERHLPLALQVQGLGWNLIIALTMTDLAVASGMTIDIEQLGQELGVQVVPIDGRTGAGVAELLKGVRELAMTVKGKTALLDPDPLLKKARLIVSRTREQKAAPRSPIVRTARLDRTLLHPIWGLLIFAGVMVGLFTAVFWLADPLMNLVDSGFGALGSLVKNLFGEGLLGDFIADGLVASFASVLVFVPQILILFLLLGVLEDSGYLARAATLVDRPLSWLGLSGRAFVPLLSGYACAVPAILAARTIRSPRERKLAIFVIPLLSCSARLPVYALLLSFLFLAKPAWQPGLVLAAIYLASMLLGGIAAALINRLAKRERDGGFLLELPLYRRPQAWVIARSALLRTKSYLRRAGPVIFVLALILWTATNFPRSVQSLSGSERIQQSYAGQVGQLIEPLFVPLGVDWRVGFGLISAFAAREVFVSALAMVFDVAGGGDEPVREALIGQMRQAHDVGGSPIFTLSSVVGLILFFMIALQCSSTTAVAWRETGSWRFAALQLIGLNVLAYGLAAFAVQMLRISGFA